MACNHCWHDTGALLASNPGQHDLMCCWCGEHQRMPWGTEFKPDLKAEHGEFLKLLPITIRRRQPTSDIPTNEQQLRTADIGKIVHYMPSNPHYSGAGPLPAMILRVLEDGTCNLMAFFDGDSSYGLKRLKAVPYSATGEPGTWHWIGEAL